MLELNKIHHGNCFDLLPLIPDGSVDAVITDPPYGILKGHRIETNVDIPRFFAECKRVMKPNAFIAFFGMMPTLPYWMMGAVDCGLKFKDHVVWVKRNISFGGDFKINRTHEDIIIMYNIKGDYFKTQGYYEDIAIPKTIDGIYNIMQIKSHFEYQRKKLSGEEYRTRWDHTTVENVHKRSGGLNNLIKDVGRAESDFTNVWSFLPENKTSLGDGINHPTVKPIELLKRLVELLTPEPTDDYAPLILDPFVGSGTTALACQDLNRNFIAMELYADYVEIARKRLTTARNLFTDPKFTTTDDNATMMQETKQGEMF